jgi:hypothetical protein
LDKFSSKFEYSKRFFSAGAGTQTAALAFGGQPVTAATESYNGTSWTTS